MAVVRDNDVVRKESKLYFSAFSGYEEEQMVNSTYERILPQTMREKAGTSNTSPKILTVRRSNEVGGDFNPWNLTRREHVA